MASIKVKFRPSVATDREGTIYYQIIQDRKVRQHFTDYRVLNDEWDEKRAMVKCNPGMRRYKHLLRIRDGIKRDVSRLMRIISSYDNSGLPYTVEELVEEFILYNKEYTLFNFIETLIDRFIKNGKLRTAETYKATLRSFYNFRGGEDLMLDAIESTIMEAYEAWHRMRGVAPNTISFYTRILRAVYNRAVEERIIEDLKPFRHVYTSVDKTIKRALPLPMLRNIKELDLSGRPNLEYARDIFFLSFYLRGMSFIDMAFLRKSDLMDGYVTYRRRKTGQQLMILWTREMQDILNRYPENESEYLLPIIRSHRADERVAYRNASYRINRSLKKIAAMVGIPIPLTLYVARHSWASAAKAKGIPISVISEGMGHDSESTTKIYLDSLDTSVVDRANAVIIKSL